MEESKIDKKGIIVETAEMEQLDKIARLIDHYNDNLFEEIYHKYNYKRNPRNRIGEFKVAASLRRDDTGVLLVDAALCSASKTLAAAYCTATESDAKEMLKGFLVEMCISGVRSMFQRGTMLDEDAI